MKTRFIDVFLVTYIICLLVFFPVDNTISGENQQDTYRSSLYHHPIYSNYRFKNAINIINVGTQPLYLPTGFITEAMKRDAVLRESLQKLGFGVAFYDFLKGDDVNFFLKNGDIEVGIGGDMPALSAAATLDVIIPALIQLGFTSIVATRPMLIKELRRQDIGYAFGSNAHYALLNVLSSHHLTNKHVNLSPMETIEMPDALHEGKISAFSAWEPTPTITLKKYPGTVILHRSLSSGFMYFSKTTIRKHQEIIKHIIASEIRAMKWMQLDRKNLFTAGQWTREAGKNLSKQNMELTVEEFVKLAKEDILGLTSAPVIPQNALKKNGPLNREFNFLQALGKIPATITWHEIRKKFDRQILTEILTNQRKYKLDEFNYSSKFTSD